jgi:DNA-directed RNA polymerase subunit K/omega
MSKKTLTTAADDKTIESNGESSGEELSVKLNSTDSLYRGIIVACLRTKQLIKGATPRTPVEFSHKRKSTRVALEEIRLGLVYFKELPDEIL